MEPNTVTLGSKIPQSTVTVETNNPKGTTVETVKPFIVETRFGVTYLCVSNGTVTRKTAPNAESEFEINEKRLIPLTSITEVTTLDSEAAGTNGIVLSSQEGWTIVIDDFSFEDFIKLVKLVNWVTKT